MMEYILNENDPRVGKFAADKSIERWPTLMLNGMRLVRKRAVTMKKVGNGFFVCPAPRQDSPELVVKIEAAPKAGKAKE